MEVLECPGREVLALGDILQPGSPLDEGTGNAPQPQRNREADADRTAADDDDLESRFYSGEPPGLLAAEKLPFAGSQRTSVIHSGSTPRCGFSWKFIKP